MLNSGLTLKKSHLYSMSMEAPEFKVSPRAGDDELTSKQRAFVSAYVLEPNAPKAYRAAGYVGTVAGVNVNASQLLRQPIVAAEIARLEAQRLDRAQKRSGVTLEKTLTEIAKGAFYDPRRMFAEDGSALQIKDLGDIEAAAIEGFDVEETFVGKGDERVSVGRIVKVKLAKRSVALDMLMKHLNGYKAHEQGKGEGAVNALADLLGGMRRSSLQVVERVDGDGDGQG
jgi:phage terminase small subunit